MKKIKYCDNCGADIEELSQLKKENRICPLCRNKIYDPIIVGSGGLIEKDGKILLIKRTHNPFKNNYNLPSGHVNNNENPEDAAIREVYEETGLKVEIDYLYGNYFFDDHPDGSGINIVYKCNIIGGNLKDTIEGKESKYFSIDNLPAKIAGGGHDKAINDWKMRVSMNNTDLNSQLSNVINSRSSQDQVLWTIFGAFAAVNAILLVALFQDGGLPSKLFTGMTISFVGLFISTFWYIMQRRALSHILFLEAVREKIELSLNIMPEHFISPNLNKKLSDRFLYKKPKARNSFRVFSRIMILFWIVISLIQLIS